MLPGLLILVACQTAPTPEPLDVRALQDEAVAEAKAEWCRGQEPIMVGVLPEHFDAGPIWAKTYVAANDAQWEAQCAG